MLAAFIGDSHGWLDLMYQSALGWQESTGQRLDLVVQVGDFGIWPTPESVDRATAKHADSDGQIQGGDFPAYLKGEKTVPILTYFCRGNHSDQVYLRERERELEKASPHNFWRRPVEIIPNLLYIPDGHIVDIQGIRFAAWGGNFASRTWDKSMPYWKAAGRRMNHMTRDRFEKLLGEEVDVFITHDGPSGIGLQGRTHVKGVLVDEMTGNGVPQIRELIEKSGCSYSFSGHYHQFIKTEIGQSKHHALGKVYPGGDPTKYMVVVEL